MDPLIIGAGITALGGLANTLAGTSASQNLNWQNRRWQEKMSKLAYQRQRELTQDQYSLAKQGMINAGYSPAAMQGYSGGTASISSSGVQSPNANPYTPFDAAGVVNTLMQGEQLKINKETAAANNRKTNADAEAQELDNKAKKEEQHVWEQNTEHKYFINDAGERVYGSDSDFNDEVKKYSDHHNGELPELIVVPGVHSESAASVSSKLAQMSTDQIQSEFASKVLQLKLADKDVMRAVYSMDKAQYNQLVESANKLKSDREVNKSIKALNDAKTSESKQAAIESAERVVMLKLQEKLQKNSNIANLIDSLDFSSFENGLRSFAKLLLVSAVGNNGGFLH